MQWVRPSFWPTLFLVPALVILIGLGLWQVQRLDEKTALLTEIETGLAAEPAVLPTVLSEPDDWQYRRVEIEGRFLHEEEIFLASRTYRGQPGLHVITPLLRTDGGPTVLVNRGWIPLDRREAGSRLEGQVDGPLTLTGIARVPPPRGWMQPDNDPVDNLWFWLDLPAMAATADIGPAPDLIIEADRSGEGYPIGGQTRLDIPNNHLQYAVTWFAFAGTLLVIYVLYHRRRETAVQQN